MSLDILLARDDAVMRPEPGPNPDNKRYRVYYDEGGMPVSVRDTLPFHESRFEDEAGYDVLERYYLVFDFEAGGLMAEVTRTWTDAEFCGEYSYGFVELDRLDRKVKEALIRSGRLEEMHAIVLESLEKEVHEIFGQAVRRLQQG
jgi:hypothetical protein